MVNEEMSDVNRSSAHHSQRLPAFMLKEIQSYSNVVVKVDDDTTDEQLDDNDVVKLTKSQLSELRKSVKLKGKLGLIESYTSNKEYCLHLHAKPIPFEILTTLESHDHLLKVIQDVCSTKEKTIVINTLSDTIKEDIQKLYDELTSQFQQLPKQWKNCVDRIWSIGPKGVNNNILINNINDYDRPNIWEGLVEAFPLSGRNLRDFDNSVVSGFQLAAQAGPICEEPLMGVAFFVEEWKHIGWYQTAILTILLLRLKKVKSFTVNGENCLRNRWFRWGFPRWDPLFSFKYCLGYIYSSPRDLVIVKKIARYSKIAISLGDTFVISLQLDFLLLIIFFTGMIFVWPNRLK